MNNLESAKERLAAAFERLEKIVYNNSNKKSAKLQKELDETKTNYKKLDNTASEVVSDLNKSIEQIELLLQQRHGNS
jgi:archaellum component FlaC